MSALWQVLRLIVRLERRSLWRGAVLSVAVLAAGAALLGLSGWFITASGLAGMAGIKLTFDVFRPSAGVRFLALGRTAARYGERLLTHEATLRALVTLRLVVLARQMRAPSEALARLRGGAALNRIVSDVDALDGLTLRLVLPLAAGVVTLAGAAVMLGWLVHPLVGALVAGGYALGGGLALMRVAKAGRVPSITAEAALQRLRLGTIELLRGRSDLIVFGQMQDRLQDLAAADHEARAAARALDRIERRAGLGPGDGFGGGGGGRVGVGRRAGRARCDRACRRRLGVLCRLGLGGNRVGPAPGSGRTGPDAGRRGRCHGPRNGPARRPDAKPQAGSRRTGAFAGGAAVCPPRGGAPGA